MPNSVLGTGNTAGTPPVLAVVGNSTDEVACSAEIETQAWKRDIWTQDGGWGEFGDGDWHAQSHV